MPHTPSATASARSEFPLFSSIYNQLSIFKARQHNETKIKRRKESILQLILITKPSYDTFNHISVCNIQFNNLALVWLSLKTNQYICIKVYLDLTSESGYSVRKITITCQLEVITNN